MIAGDWQLGACWDVAVPDGCTSAQIPAGSYDTYWSSGSATCSDFGVATGGSLSLLGASSFSLVGSSPSSVAAGALLNLDELAGGTLSIAATAGAQIQVAGDFIWRAGELDSDTNATPCITIQPSGTLQFRDSSNAVGAAAIVLAASVSLTSSSLQNSFQTLASSGTGVTLATTGQFLLSNNAAFDFTAGTHSLQAGTYTFSLEARVSC